MEAEKWQGKLLTEHWKDENISKKFFEWLKNWIRDELPMRGKPVPEGSRKDSEVWPATMRADTAV